MSINILEYKTKNRLKFHITNDDITKLLVAAKKHHPYYYHDNRNAYDDLKFWLFNLNYPPVEMCGGFDECRFNQLLQKYKKDTDEVWSSITTNQGSVSHLDFLNAEEKDTFKTAFEIDQRWVVELGADRTPHISQAQSVNIFIPADIHKKDLHDLHFQAWKKGLKSLYYCRSKSIQRAENVNDAKSTDITANVYKSKQQETDENKYEECLSCQ